MLSIPTTSDIANELKSLYKAGIFREGKYGKTVEIQNAHFLADSDTIIRKPNYEYANREIEWYKSKSLFVKDIPGDTPKIWQMCADKDGKINSNYGWCIWSKENGNQLNHCIKRLVDDPHTREACMIYNRPSMQVDCNANGMHDFMCTYSTQHFLNEVRSGVYQLDYIVFMRSNDAIFGYTSDFLWHKHVHSLMVDLLNKEGLNVILGDMIWNAASLHVYERHFRYLS